MSSCAGGNSATLSSRLLSVLSRGGSYISSFSQTFELGDGCNYTSILFQTRRRYLAPLVSLAPPPNQLGRNRYRLSSPPKFICMFRRVYGPLRRNLRIGIGRIAAILYGRAKLHLYAISPRNQNTHRRRAYFLARRRRFSTRPDLHGAFEAFRPYPSSFPGYWGIRPISQTAIRATSRYPKSGSCASSHSLKPPSSLPYK